MFKKDDRVKLKEPVQGRYFNGKVTKIEPTKTLTYITVTLPNGYYVVFDETMWELDTEVIAMTE